MARSSKGVIVLGMHRAGTSATGHILVDLGFELPGEPVPADEDNPRGYWEPHEIVAIHDDFLHGVERSWSDPRPLSPAVFEGKPAEAARRRLSEAIERVVVPRPQWVLKDPRMCRLMPLWNGLLETHGLEYRFLHILRSPLAVAESLLERDRFGHEKSMVLWLRHNLEAEAATRGRKRSWLHFEQLANGSGGMVDRRIRAATGSSRLSSKRIRAAVEGVLDPSLVHHHHDLEESLARLEQLPWIATAYRALSSLAAGGGRKAEAILDDLRGDILKADSLRLSDPAVWETELTGERFFWLRQSIETQRKEIEAQRAEVDALRDVFNGEREVTTLVRQRLADQERATEARHDELIAWRKADTEQRQALTEMLSHLTRELDQVGILRESIASALEPLATTEAKEERIEALQGALDNVTQHQATSAEQRRDLVASVGSLTRQLDELQQVLDRISGSQTQFTDVIAQRLDQSASELAAQDRQLQELTDAIAGVARGQSVAASERHRLEESLDRLTAHGEQLEQLQHAAQGQDRQWESLSSAVGEIESLLTDRLEKRHLALLGKSLEVSSRIESLWTRAQETRDALARDLETQRLEHARTLHERDVARQERDTALRDREALEQQHETIIRKRDRELGQQLEAFDRERSRLNEVIEQVSQERDQARAEISQLLARVSWKLTAPLRWSLRVLKGRRS